MIFVDTGALLAKYLVRDQHHQSAIAFWLQLTESETHLVTSSHVVSETLTLLGRRSDYRFAADRARSLFASTHLQIIRATEKCEVDAVQWFERMASFKVSFTDCISFALMHTLGINEAFTFDLDFVHAGFVAVPKS